MKTLNVIDWIAIVLVIVGAINWGLVGVFSFDLVMAIFGGISAWVYGLVGVAGLYMIYTVTKVA